jgi:hypothetical protein
MWAPSFSNAPPDREALMGFRGTKDASGRPSVFVYTDSTDSVMGARLESDAQVNRFSVNAAGKIEWGAGSASATDAALERQAAGILSVLSSGAETIRMGGTPSTSADSNIRVVTNIGGTSTLKIVSVGSSDSGGTGYRLLRVPNGP